MAGGSTVCGPIGPQLIVGVGEGKNVPEEEQEEHEVLSTFYVLMQYRGNSYVLVHSAVRASDQI